MAEHHTSRRANPRLDSRRWIRRPESSPRAASLFDALALAPVETDPRPQPDSRVRPTRSTHAPRSPRR
jgi:hypothetical protein